ncbi:hypothetical protein V3C99_014902, partial [Haemonchus contortus]
FQAQNMVSLNNKKKAPSCRTSRHKKKYWRKGTDIADAEKVLHGKTHDSMEVKKDEELFAIDRTPREPVRHTKRQQAALNKISQSIGQERQALPAPKFPTKKQPRLKQQVKRHEPTKPVPQKDTYDLWEKDFVPKVDIEFKEAGEHLLRYTKKKLPNMPSTCRFKPSLLNAVTMPDGGASYNPKAEDYQSYVEEIAMEETKLINEEQRIEKASKPKFESVVTYAEKRLEETEGLVIDPRYNADDDNEVEEQNDVEMEHVDEKNEKVPISHLLRKTRKQKANAIKEKKLQREHKRRKEVEKAQHDVYRAKSINKALEQAEKESLEKSVKRKKQKFLEKMTTRQRLGRGEFKDYEEPFLLQEELADSLRLLKPQGHVLNERMASLQKRNMLPIGGERNKKKLKTKLKKKFVEKRSVAEVTKGSRVI